MGDKQRQQLLERKRQETEKEYAEWARSIGLLGVDERLLFKIEISLAHLVSGIVVDHGAKRPPLPNDKEHSHGPGKKPTRESYCLAEEDWDRIASVPWTQDWQAKLVTLLRAINNGPLTAEEVIQYCGVQLHVKRSHEKGWFHTLLRKCSNYEIGSGGSYFSLEQFSSGVVIYYAIKKYGYF